MLNKSADGKNKKAILYIHGLTGDPYGFSQTVMAQRFPDQGYDVIRPYLYHANDDARKLVDCTIQTHADDIATLFAHFKNDYDTIYVVGHSYGGPSIMSSSAMNKFTAICLWDPTYNPSITFNPEDNIELGPYIVMTASGTYRLMGKDMYAERQLFTQDHSRALAASCTVPLKVILAADGIWGKHGESFHDFAAGPSESIIIPNTIHCFYEEGTIEPLLKQTKSWFDRFKFDYILKRSEIHLLLF